VTHAELQTAVLAALADVAPEVSPQTLRPDAPFREQIDLDSFDFLNFMIGLHTRLGVEIPEADYPRLGTLDAAVEYLEKRLAR
jgi:acyl carrier protein